MINFWSYKREYRKYKKSLLKQIDKTINKGNIFFGDQLKIFEKNFIKKIRVNMVLLLEAVQMLFLFH